MPYLRDEFQVFNSLLEIESSAFSDPIYEKVVPKKTIDMNIIQRIKNLKNRGKLEVVIE